MAICKSYSNGVEDVKIKRLTQDGKEDVMWRLRMGNPTTYNATIHGTLFFNRTTCYSYNLVACKRGQQTSWCDFVCLTGTYIIVKGEHKAISVCTHIHIPFLLVYKSIQLWHVLNISGPKKITMHFVTLRNHAFDYFHFLLVNQYNDDRWRRWWSIIHISWSASINISRKQRSYSHALAPDQGGERETMKESDIQDSRKALDCQEKPIVTSEREHDMEGVTATLDPAYVCRLPPRENIRL
jgi:hypothetical protein